jgi:tetratricopeptide (TPR) repeat protein
VIARFALLVVVGLGLSGCGMLGGLFGGGTQEPKAAADEQLESARRNAALAFEQGRFDQAQQLYRQALDRAMTRDDGILIGDIGYNLAVTELRRGADAASLAMAQASASELRRRGLPIFAELLLVEAAAFYRLEQIPAAEVAAASGGRPFARQERHAPQAGLAAPCDEGARGERAQAFAQADPRDHRLRQDRMGLPDPAQRLRMNPRLRAR